MLLEVLEHVFEDGRLRVDNGSVFCVYRCQQLSGEYVSEYGAFDAFQRLQFCRDELAADVQAHIRRQVSQYCVSSTSHESLGDQVYLHWLGLLRLFPEC